MRVIKKADYEFSMPKMDGYDIIILNESLFDGKVIRHLNQVRDVNADVRIIALNTLLNVKESNFHDGLIDLYLFKPVNQERVFELIISLYDTSLPRALVQDDVTYEDQVLPKRFGRAYLRPTGHLVIHLLQVAEGSLDLRQV